MVSIRLVKYIYEVEILTPEKVLEISTTNCRNSRMTTDMSYDCDRRSSVVTQIRLVCHQVTDLISVCE